MTGKRNDPVGSEAPALPRLCPKQHSVCPGERLNWWKGRLFPFWDALDGREVGPPKFPTSDAPLSFYWLANTRVLLFLFSSAAGPNKEQGVWKVK